MDALEEHLLELEKQRKHMDDLIRTVKQTILSMKGECEMSDQEKFEVLKERAIRENEARYGEESRGKYGEEAVEELNQKLLNLTEQEWKTFQKLEKGISDRLKEGVFSGMKPESEEAGEIVRLHKEWLCMMWKKYTAEAHKGTASLYVSDKRFQSYYDREAEGCAQLLYQAILYWADRF